MKSACSEDPQGMGPKGCATRGQGQGGGSTGHHSPLDPSRLRGHWVSSRAYPPCILSKPDSSLHPNQIGSSSRAPLSTNDSSWSPPGPAAPCHPVAWSARFLDASQVPSLVGIPPASCSIPAPSAPASSQSLPSWLQTLLGTSAHGIIPLPPCTPGPSRCWGDQVSGPRKLCPSSAASVDVILRRGRAGPPSASVEWASQAVKVESIKTN